MRARVTRRLRTKTEYRYARSLATSRSRSLATGRLRTETESGARIGVKRDYGTVALLVSRSRRTHGRPVATSSPFVLTLKTVVQTFRCLPSTRPRGRPAMDAGGGGETRLASSSGVGAEPCRRRRYARDVVNANDTT